MSRKEKPVRAEELRRSVSKHEPLFNGLLDQVTCRPLVDRLQERVVMLLSPGTFVPRRVRAVVVLVGTICSVGCAQPRSAPTPAPTGAEAPVDVRDIQLATVEGHKAVLLRLTRVPSRVRSSSSQGPAQIELQAWGPTGDTDLPERGYPQADAYVPEIRVSRKGGELRIVLLLAAEVPPNYSVHEMADWIMVRLLGARES